MPVGGAPSSNDQTASAPASIRSPLRSPPAIINLGAILIILTYLLVIFGEHIFGTRNFIGDSDRLETFLNIKIFELTSILNLGRVPAWNEHAFMGFPTHSLPWMLPGFDPIIWIVSLFPVRYCIYLFGLVSIFWYFLAGVAAYYYFEKECKDPVTAVFVAILYISSYMAVLRIAQVDNAFFVVVLIPLGMLALTSMADAAKPRNVLGFIAVVAVLLGFCFLQEAAYALLLFGFYTVYLYCMRRRVSVLVLPGLAVGLAILVAFPRLAAVANEFSHSSRPTRITVTAPYEIFRWLHDGIFGRSPEEAGNPEILNVHEGLQIFTSTFVPLFVFTGLALPRNKLALFGAGTLYLVVLLTVFQIFEMRWRYIIAVSLVFILLIWSMTKFQQGSKPDSDNVGFHSIVTAILLASILFLPVRTIIYYLFLQQEFTHSRLSEIANLTVLTLVASYLTRACGRDATLAEFVRRHWRGAILGIFCGCLFGLVRNLIDESTLFTALGFGFKSVSVVPVAIVEIVLCAAIYLALLIGYFAFRGKPLWQQTLVFTLATLMVVDGGSYVMFELRGPQSDRYPIPFDHNSLMMAPARVFRLPDAGTLEAVHRKLEVNDYRSAFIVDSQLFGSQPASFLSQFWQLRLVDGYSPAVSGRLASMPWQGQLSNRSIKFSSVDSLNWRLLAYLNVKYAILSDLRFYYNLRDLAAEDPFSADQLNLVENPYPVMPRAFFARRIEPVQRISAANSDAALVTKDGIVLPSDARTISVVEGLTAPSDFTGGNLDAVRSDGDRVVLSFPASNVDRFLVLNELYAPEWTAESERGPVPVLATNVVMRGVRVKPGVSSITFIYRSRLFSPFLLAVSALGVLGGLALCLVGPAIVSSRRVNS